LRKKNGGMNMRTEIKQVQKKLDNAGHKADDAVEAVAEKHNFEKWQVWLGVLVALMAAVGIAHLAGWI
jgi:uncharacterized membrane protein YjjP (DUF1212 family)